MNTKKGLYHKRCFSCIACRSQLDYFGAIEGPDDEVRNGTLFARKMCLEVPEKILKSNKI